MENKTTMVVLVVVIGVILGIGISSKQMRDPILKDLVMQQKEMLMLQKNGTTTSGNAGGSALAAKVDSLEKKIADLEDKLKVLDPILKQAQNKGKARQQPQEDLSKVHTIDVAHSPLLGNKDAKVSVVEFVDFQCPFCARFHTPLAEATKEFPNDVNYMVKNFPLSFHPQARPASKAAFAAGEQGKYFEMVDLLLENGRVLNDDKFKELAGSLDLNVDKFMKDYKEKDAVYNEYIEKDLKLGSTVGVRGTPTFFINGKKTQARDVAGFKREFENIINAK